MQTGVTRRGFVKHVFEGTGELVIKVSRPDLQPV